MNTRRKLVIALGASPFVIPRISFAQVEARVWRVGFLATPSRPTSLDSHFYGAFPRGMRDLGYVEGKNLFLEWRFADNNLDRLPELAAELVRLKVDLIVAVATPSTIAAQKMTSTIPIVMAANVDPVGVGLIKSLARPGGNTTGLSNLALDLAPKRLEMLLTMVPKLSRVAVLVNSTNQQNIKALASTQAAGQKRRVTILPAEARNPQEINNAFERMVQEKADALIVLLHPLFQQQRSQIAELSAKYRLPSMTADAVYTEAGCLMSYGDSLADNFYSVAKYVDNILRGAKPADLPVEEPTKIELIINGKAAKTLGLTIPQSLLISADKLIE